MSEKKVKKPKLPKAIEMRNAALAWYDQGNDSPPKMRQFHEIQHIELIYLLNKLLEKK